MIITLRSKHGYEHELENQSRFSEAQREMAIEHPHLVFFVVRRKTLPAKVRRAVFERDEGLCYHCDVALDFAHFHVDHLHPVCLGGTDDMENLAASCPPCNLAKGAS